MLAQATNRANPRCDPRGRLLAPAWVGVSFGACRSGSAGSSRDDHWGKGSSGCFRTNNGRASSAPVAYTLAAIKDWTFLLGPGWVVGWGNGLILGYLMYKSGLVPQKMTWLGLVGGPLIILSGTLVLFGVADAGGALQGIATIPEGLWELSLGIYCTVKGFRPSSPILRADIA